VSRILRVTAEGVEVRVDADGPVDNVDSFVLNNPERVVADFWGAQNAASPVKFNVEEGVIRQVRIGQHPDKVRVVMDLRSPIASHLVEPTGSGVRIRFEWDGKTAEEVSADADAVPAAPEVEPMTSEEEPAAPEVEPMTSEEEPAAPEVEPMTPEEEPADADEKPISTSSALVRSAHFESLPGRDRVVLDVGQEVETRLAEPDPSTIVVDLIGVRISNEAERRVNTREFSGPVDLFSVFQTPDVEGDQVRIVLKRQGTSQPQVSWEGGTLMIELSHGAETAKNVEPAAAEETQEPMSPSGTATGATLAPLPAARPDAAIVSPQAAAPPTPVPAPASPLENPFGEDPLLAGPADPASIDVLEEGGFSEDKAYDGRRISLDFKDADIGNILRLIAEVSDLNIIAGEEVEGKVTIRLVDVPWDQAMDVILMTKGLGFVRVGNVLRIAPLETLKLENEARLQERRAKEKLEDLVVKLQPVNYASVNEVQALVQRLLSSRGSVNVDERTNTLIIKDIPSVIHEATALVKAIDTQTPQVLIEAKIVEASLNFSRSLGATWGIGYNANGSDGGNGEFRLADDTLDAVIPVPDDHQQSNFIASNPVVGIVNGLLTLGTLGLDDHLQLDLRLLAAEENNRGKVISSPRVVTLDNREAVIKQGVAIKFTEITRDTVTTSFVDAVLELKVTPHITANRAIIMKIKVSRNAPQLSTASGDIVGIAKNETETEALVRDGETMVLGGIYVVDNGKAGTKFPFLADIPIFGTAFKSKSVTDARRELLIFVTPRIVLGPASDV
jgi:type IV pilus assembly protein PilQ